MPKDNKMKQSFNTLKGLGSNLHWHMGQQYVRTSPDMPLKRMRDLSASNKTMHDMFQPVLNEAKLAKPLLKAVVEGNPDQLIELVKENPLHLFEKGQIKDPSGQVFYNVSAYQMMKYVCDDDMLAKVMSYVPEEIRNGQSARIVDLQKEQDVSMQGGGADLIKLNFAPPKNPLDFDRILQHTETYTINDQQHQATFPLMENQDAILYYKGADGKSNWYYANRETRTIEPIQTEAHSEIEQNTLDALKQSMDTMENNSARRSNDAEHDIIAKAMNKSLVRNGIQYEQDGKRCCDTRHDFNRYYNAYRECIRLYSNNRYDVEGDKVWCEKLGSAQKEVMWLLQRYCEENRPFCLRQDFKSSPFNRGLNLDVLRGERWVLEEIYKEGNFAAGFGSEFAIYKGAAAAAHDVDGVHLLGAISELIAVNRLVESAKINVVEFKLEQGLPQDAPRPR